MTVAAVVFAVAAASLALGLGLKPAARPAGKTADTPRAGSAAPDVAQAAQYTFRHPVMTATGLAPAPAPSATGSQARPPSPRHPSTAPPSTPQLSSPPPSSPQTAAPAPAPPPTASNPISAPAPTAEYQTPRGANELAWSEAILTKLGAPLTDANIESMGYWMQNEAGSPPSGIVGANNPINVSQPGYGGTPIKSEGGGYYLYSYPNPTDGIDAILAYLVPSPTYSGIVAALRAGSGLSSSSLGQAFSIYSGGGYSTVPDTWGASQGQPETP